MFSLYGSSVNWFRDERVRDDEKAFQFNSIDSHDLTAWPTAEELNLGSYTILT